MVDEPDLSTACVADNMVLAMFVDADQIALFSAFAGGNLFVSPSIVDPAEMPPFAVQPVAEFARGIFHFQQRIGRPLDSTRLVRRMAFCQAKGTAWHPVALSPDELRLAVTLISPAIWAAAQAVQPGLRRMRIDAGEAECAAVAITRGWRLWSDDAAIVTMLGALYPGCRVERISDLLSRAVRQGLISCPAAADLYNREFKGNLRLWSRLTAACHGEELLFD